MLEEAGNPDNIINYLVQKYPFRFAGKKSPTKLKVMVNFNIHALIDINHDSSTFKLH